MINEKSYDDFKDFYIFPHEYLCLAANSHNRLKLIGKVYKPNWEDLKIKGQSNLNQPINLEQKCQFLFEFGDEDLNGPGQPHGIF